MDDISTEVRRYVRYLRRYWWVLVAGAVVGGLATLALNGLSSSLRGTQSLVVLSERWTGASSTAQPGSLFGEDPEALDVALARISDDATIDELGERFDIQRSQITFPLLEGRRVFIQIRAEADVARAAGQVLLAELDASRVQDTLVPVDLAIGAVEARLETLSSELAGADEATADSLTVESARLGTQLTLLQSAARAIPTELTSEIVSQTNDETTSRTSSLIAALIGAFAGVVIAAVAIIVWSVLDRRVTTRRDVEAITGPGSLLAVVPRHPRDIDLRAAAAAINHLRPTHPDLSLVRVGHTNGGVAASIATLSTTPCVEVDEVLSSPSAVACVPVAGSGDVTAAELERLQFVLQRAGGGVAGVILVGGRNGVDLLD